MRELKTVPVGATYGELTVIEPAEPIVQKDGRRQSATKVRCSCGSTTVVPTTSLSRGIKRQCTPCGQRLRDEAMRNASARSIARRRARAQARTEREAEKAAAAKAAKVSTTTTPAPIKADRAAEHKAMIQAAIERIDPEAARLLRQREIERQNRLAALRPAAPDPLTGFNAHDSGQPRLSPAAEKARQAYNRDFAARMAALLPRPEAV